MILYCRLCRLRARSAKLDSQGSRAGLLLYRPFGPGVQVEEIVVKTATELERAGGPAESSHAREGVVQVTDKMEG